MDRDEGGREIERYIKKKDIIAGFFRKHFQGGKPMFREIEGGIGWS